MGSHLGGSFRGFHHPRGFAFGPYDDGYFYGDGGYGCTRPLERVWTSQGWRWRRIC
jgi:hypothetical protein